MCEIVHECDRRSADTPSYPDGRCVPPDNSEKWPEFQRRYRQELRAREDLVRQIAKMASRGRVTLVYGARDEEHNDAVVLAAVVRARMRRATTKTRGDARQRKEESR